MLLNPLLSSIFLATSKPVKSLLFSIFLYLLYDIDISICDMVVISIDININKIIIYSIVMVMIHVMLVKPFLFFISVF